MNIPLKYEDVVAKLDAALGREAALREELRKWKEIAWRHSQDRDEIQQRLTVAEQRAENWRVVSSEATCRAAAINDWVGELEKALADVPRIHFEGCDFQGLNADGSEPLEFTDDTIKKIKSIRLIGWRCEGPRITALKPAAEGEGS